MGGACRGDGVKGGWVGPAGDGVKGGRAGGVKGERMGWTGGACRGDGVDGWCLQR